jgi:hypothetical protein
MRGFAQTLFNALLGWIRMLVEAVWSLLFSDGTKAWLTWIGNNWLALVVLLCLIGVAIDYLIWFVRWRPYYVWGAKMRRFGRIFGIGRKDREMPQAPVRAARSSYAPPPAPLTVEDFEPEQAYPEPVKAYPGPAWEDAVWEEQDEASLPDTIHARPRKADLKEQYIRRFARPASESVPEEQEYTQPYGAGASSWENGPEEYLAEAVAEPAPAQEEYPPEDWAEAPSDMSSENSLSDTLPEETSPFWDDGTLPKTPPAQKEERIHPGIDYQELSRKYGWHVPMQQAGQAPTDEQEEQEQTWDSGGLENFAPYRPPAPPPAAEPRPRNERARKSKQERTPIEKVRNSLLGRAVKRAGKVLTVDDEESGKLLDGLPPPIDKRRAFHAPVYPTKMGQSPAPKDSKSPDFREDD